jgi:diaminohydroxyphosphoribosylaminopyrimidine deaminase / 5-amino-6-(5-phosphoribosylamino)uracil reductase
MTGNNDLNYMERCVDLASKAEGMTYPNPVVGSVIVHEGKIIGEGYHIKPGGPHAEVIAIGSVRNKELLASSAIYVSLEPCSHYGRTPPCTDLIISHKIPEIIVGTTDTSDKVSGKGISNLKAAGCKIILGIAEDECRWINRRFFTFHEKKRPYIILKWAQSADGFIDILREGGSKVGAGWITGNSERILVHKWRASEQAILVGAQTVRADNPLLNVREWYGNNPIRIILSGSASLPGEIAMNNLTGSQVIFTFYPDKIKMPGSVVVKLNNKEPSAVQIVDYIYKLGIQSLFIEGGAMVLNHFISSGLWDEARIFSGYQIFRNGIKAPAIEGKLFSKTKFSKSTLEILLNNSISIF